MQAGRKELPTPPSELTNTLVSRPPPEVRHLIEQHLVSMSSSLTQVAALLKQPTNGSALGKRAREATTSDDGAVVEGGGAGSMEWGGSCADLGALRSRLRDFARERDWDQFHTYAARPPPTKDWYGGHRPGDRLLAESPCSPPSPCLRTEAGGGLLRRGVPFPAHPRRPRNVCLAFVGEVGELSECFQWKGDSGCAL